MPPVNCQSELFALHASKFGEEIGEQLVSSSELACLTGGIVMYLLLTGPCTSCAPVPQTSHLRAADVRHTLHKFGGAKTPVKRCIATVYPEAQAAMKSQNPSEFLKNTGVRFQGLLI